MIVEFSVSNFGSIKDTQTLSMLAEKDDTLEAYYVVEAGGMRLLKMALLYGPNASGKTNILKALDCLRGLVLNPKLKRSEPLGIWPFQFDQLTRQSPTIFKIIFVQQDIRYDYEVILSNEYILSEKMRYYPNGRRAELFSRETDLEKQVANLRLGSRQNISAKDIAVIEGNTLWNNTVLGGFEKSNVDWPALREVQNWFRYTLQEMIQPDSDLKAFADHVLGQGQPYKDAIVTFLRKADIQIFDVEMYNIEIPAPNNGEMLIRLPGVPETSDVNDRILKFPFRNVKLNENRLDFIHRIKNNSNTEYGYGRLPWELQSHGTQRYYGLAAVLQMLIQSPNIAIIDELESGLHPELIKHFLLLFLANAGRSQLLLTTHNIQMQDDEDILRRDTIWFTQKRTDGSTELYGLSDFNSQDLRKNASVLNAYKAGKLGALPNTGSIFIPKPS